MVGPFLERDLDNYLALAAEEGWICGRWEFEFLLQNFPQGCLTFRSEGRTMGYVTSVSYGKSGWIGNLLVSPEARKKGIGRELMERAVFELFNSGVETVWLTASPSGARLYRQLGFVAIDHVERWTGRGRLNGKTKPAPLDFHSIRVVDQAGWGDRRDALLQVTCGRGHLYDSSGGFLCCQQWDDGMQIGPWGCLIGPQAAQLLDWALSGAGEKVFLDVPAGNRAAAGLLLERGFTVKGSNRLMYLGEQPLYRPADIYALASMGSMG
jgi:ribosomal protein S18 acetylase RimI-like enzyme